MLNILIALTLWGGVLKEDSYLYWVELQEMELHTSGDPSGSGEVSPLMGIGPGKMANLLKGSSEYLSVYSGRSYQISGERFYLPTHWIRNGHVDLVFFLRERDDPSADDVILPPRKVTITLEDELFKKRNGVVRANLETYVYRFREEYFESKTVLVLQVIRKRVSDCLFKGDDPDAFFQMANDAVLFQQELRFLGTRQLISGIEFKQLDFSSEKEARPRDIEIIQEANYRVCLRYREWLDRFVGSPFYSDLGPLYMKAINQIRAKKISYDDEGKKYPSLPANAGQKLDIKL